MAKKFMYGVGALKFKDKVLGYILKGSFDLGGTQGESTPVWAEQLQSAPAKTLPGSNGTIAPKFSLIEIDYEAMAAILGGAVIKTGETVTGWSAPTDNILIEGEMVIETVSKHRITIENGLLQANLGGKLDMTSVSQIDVAIQVQLSSDPTKPPYKIEDIAEV